MAYANINGTTLYYEEHGSGPPLILSHGIGSNHLHWWQQVPEFSKHYRVVIFDQRGFGFSKDENGLGPAALVNDLDALLVHLKLDRVFLCGQSMGGFAVGGYAARHPERVLGIVLSCTGAGYAPVQHAPAFKEAIARCRNYAEFAKLSIEQDKFGTRFPVLRFLFESMSQLNNDYDMTRLGDLRHHKFDIDPVVRAGIPVLLIGGEEDGASGDALRELNRLLPNSGLVVIPNAGHLLFFESAERYNRLVLDFLGDCMSSRTAAE